MAKCIHLLASGGSIIDLIFASNAIGKCGYECEVTDCISNHLAVCLHLDVPGYRAKSCEEHRPISVCNFPYAADESIIDELQLSYYLF